jgi:hypothetical protein
MAKTRIPPQYAATTADPGPKPTASDSNPASQRAFTEWLRADRDFKESQPQVISDGGKGVSN